MAFSASTTALIVIDMQGDFCVKSEDTYLGRIGLSVANTREPIEPLKIVLEELRQRSFTIIHTREGHRASLSDCPELKLWRSKLGGCELGTKGSGATCCSRALVRGEASWDIIPELQPAAGEDVVDGCGKGKFVATDLDMILRQRGVTTLVFGGVTTSCCVSTTMREASDLGYSCHVLSDCTGDCGAYDYMDTLRMLPGERVLDAQTFLSQVDASLAGKSARFPPLRAFGPSLALSANVYDAMAEGSTLDFPSLRAKLAADARAFIDSLQQRAAAEGPKLDAAGHCSSIVACDGGRTNAWPFKPEAFTPQTTALLGLDLPKTASAWQAPWLTNLVKLSAACAEAGIAGFGIDSDTELGDALRGLRMRPAGAGAFSGTDLDATLRERGITNLLIVGGGASTAINTTMRQASDRGFDTLIVADCIGAADEADLWGVTACAIRKAIFSACAHSDAVHTWLKQQSRAWKSAIAHGKRPRDAGTGGGPV